VINKKYGKQITYSYFKEMKNLLSILLLLLINLPTHGQQLIDKVPIRLIENLIFFELHVNDTPEPLNMLFDTGAGVTVIDTKIAEQLQLVISGKSKIGTSGKTVNSSESYPNKLIIGENLRLENITLIVMDLSHISNYFKSDVDGIIGFDLLEKVITETNIDSFEMRFFSNLDFIFHGNSKPSKIIDLESNHFGLPLEIIPKGSKNSILITVKIDTAADNYLTFHNELVTRYDLINPTKRYKTKQGFGADATISNNLDGKIASASFGEKKWKNIPVVFEVDPLNRNSKRKAEGLIGQKMLLDFNITYQLNEGLVYLEKRK
jgi:hypothetical protein